MRTSPRLATAALAGGALLLYFGLARPAAREAASVQAQLARLQLEQAEIEAGLAAHERALALGRQAIHMDLPADAPTSAEGRLRRSFLEAVRDQPVSGVELAVSPARTPVLAEGRLNAEGSFADLVRLSGRIVRPGAGVVLRQVRLAPSRHAALRLEIEGMSVEKSEEAPSVPPLGEPDPMPPPPARDVLRYAESPPPAPTLTPVGNARPAAARPAPTPSPEPPVPPPPPVRLVGLVRRAEGLRAAVATASGVVVVGPGDSVEGFTVMSLDEDRGLRLRAPDGGELVLPLPE